MYKHGIKILIVTLLVIVAYGLIWPASAERTLSRALKGVGITADVHIPAIIGREGSLRVVDPSAIAASISKEAASGISALLDRGNGGGEGKELIILDVIDETNKERIKEGLAPLKTNDRLLASAKKKTEDMIVLQYFEHESPSGQSVSDLGAAAGYSYIIMGENLALGNFDGAKDLVRAWMDSPGHRANILSPLYQEIGVYAAKAMYEGRDVWFAVQHFGTGRAACPSISKTLKQEIDTLNKDLDHRQQEIETLKQEIERTDAENDPEYDDKVNLFNAMVTTYNRFLTDSREKIATYNAQVSKFNACLSNYQKE